VARPDISSLFTLLLVFITNTPLPANLIAVVLTIVLIITIIGFIQTWRTTRQTGSKEGLWLLYLSFAPPLFLFLFSQWRPVYIERALLPSGAIFCIWLAWAINRTNLSNIAQYSLLGLLGFSAMLGIYQHVTYDDFPYGPFKELDVSLRQRMEPEDVIIHSNKLSMLPAMLFDRDLPNLCWRSARSGPTHWLPPPNKCWALKQSQTFNLQPGTRTGFGTSFISAPSMNKKRLDTPLILISII
jgi:hypothetical protein